MEDYWPLVGGFGAAEELLGIAAWDIWYPVTLDRIGRIGTYLLVLVHTST